jgi:hypothetical protein
MLRMNRLPLRESAARRLPAAALAMLLVCVTAAGRETKLGAVSFELPKDWKIQMDGADRLTASPTGAPETPPLVMAEFCVPASDHPCPPAEPPNAQKTGCTLPQFNTKQWSRGVAEKRWICPRVASAAGVFNLAVGHFQGADWTLRVVYIFTDKDKPPNKLLDDLAKSLRKN